MTGNKFWIGGSWDWRPESPEQLGEKVVRTLDALSRLNPHFTGWDILDRDFDLLTLEHSDNPVVPSFAFEDIWDRMSEIVERGVARDEDRIPEPRMGYSIIASNERDNPMSDPFTVSLSVHGGGVPGTRCGLSFEAGDDQFPDLSIVAYPVFKAVLVNLLSIWNLSSVCARSKRLSQLGDYPPLAFDLSWMTYLSEAEASEVTLPPSVVSEHVSGGGLLLIAAEETFDTSNPLHMTAARKIRDACAPLNDLEGHERMKQEILEDERRLQATGFPGYSITAQEIRRRQRS